RMWAGGRLRYLSALRIGSQADRVSRIVQITPRKGKSGNMCFVTLEHRTLSDGMVCIVEEQDLVYREATPAQTAQPPAARPSSAAPELADSQWQRVVRPDAVTLFRYSALTFNGHRIHYDLPYACNVEGYRSLVVHGPLTATLLQQFAVECAGGRALSTFDFRGVAPLLAGSPFRLEARTAADDSLSVWARGPEGELAMSATATFR